MGYTFTMELYFWLNVLLLLSIDQEWVIFDYQTAPHGILSKYYVIVWFQIQYSTHSRPILVRSERYHRFPAPPVRAQGHTSFMIENFLGYVWWLQSMAQQVDHVGFRLHIVSFLHHSTTCSAWQWPFGSVCRSPLLGHFSTSVQMSARMHSVWK